MLKEILDRKDFDAFLEYEKNLDKQLDKTTAQYFCKGCILFNRRQSFGLAKRHLNNFIYDDYTSLFLSLALSSRFNQTFNENDLKALSKILVDDLSDTQRAKLTNLMGLNYLWLDKLKEAEKCFQQSFELNSECIDPLINQNMIYEKSDNYLALLGNLEKLRKLSPDNFNINISLARTLIKIGKLVVAEQFLASFPGYEKLDKAQVAVVEKYRNDARVELRKFDRDDELAVTRKHFVDYNDQSKALWDYALDLIKIGNYRKGYRLYSKIRNCGEKPAVQLNNQGLTLPKFCWERGASLILIEEQGIGDIIQFLMMLPTFVEKFAPKSIELLIEPRLAKAIKVHINKDFLDFTKLTVCSSTYELKNASYLHVGDLPKFCIDEFLTKPKLIPLLQRYETRFDLGFMWRGGVKQVDQMKRSLKLTDLIDKFPSGVRKLSLQYQVTDNEADILNQSSAVSLNYDARQDLVSWFRDILSCRLIVGIDNSAIHIAASAFIETHLLSRIPFEYRWGQNDNVFYKNMSFHSITPSSDAFDALVVDICNKGLMHNDSR